MEGSRAPLAHLETLSVYFSSSSFVVRVNVLYPCLVTVFFILVNYYLQFNFVHGQN